MAATTTPLINKIVRKIEHDYPSLRFKRGKTFYWSSSEQTIVYAPITKPGEVGLLLHEISHAELGHFKYSKDVELVKCESLAWQHAKKLAGRYGVKLDEALIEDALDTYRLWLHKRSLCPNCSQTGLQRNENTYSCLNCRCSWRVNEARLCNLRRKNLGHGFAAAAN